jgi:hypothetical protein
MKILCMLCISLTVLQEGYYYMCVYVPVILEFVKLNIPTSILLYGN